MQPVHVLNWTSFSVQNYHSTYHFPTSSCVAEITLPFAGADRGSLRMSTDIFVFLSNVIA